MATGDIYDPRGNVISTSLKVTTLNKTRSWSTAYTYDAARRLTRLAG